MAHTRRIRREPIKAQALVRSRELAVRLAERRLGGMVLVDYLFSLFAASPLEAFSRVSVLSVLDQVRKDNGLFPTGAQTDGLEPNKNAAN